VKTPLHFYPGITNPRALPANEHAQSAQKKLPNSAQTFSLFLESYSALRAQNPWHRHQPLLAHLLPGENNTLIDQDGMALPCRSTLAKEQLFQAISGGQPTLTCAEWDGHALQLLSAVSEDQLIDLTSSNE